jgi:hypothetical protein
LEAKFLVRYDAASASFTLAKMRILDLPLLNNQKVKVMENKKNSLLLRFRYNSDFIKAAFTNMTV